MSYASDHALHRNTLSNMRKAAAAAAYSILRDHHKAEDVAQDVMLNLFRKLVFRASDAHTGVQPSFVLVHQQRSYDPRKFAYLSGHWKARDLRRKGVRQEVFCVPMDGMPDSETDSDLRAFEANDMLRHILSNLSGSERAILMRQGSGQMQNASAADRKRLQRARTAARALYDRAR